MIIIGIDEAGRGPLAGPVTVGAFSAEEKVGRWIVKNIFDNNLRDSKKLSEKKREEIYKKLIDLKNESRVDFAFSHISSKVIDQYGINKAVNRGIVRCLMKISTSYTLSRGRGILYKPENLSIRLDGLLKAPAEYKNQKTIIRGDEKDVFIACASIVAKVLRDRFMCKIAKMFPVYKFDIHKGYGTSLHRQIVQKSGLSLVHRKSYCKNMVKS